jgi:hypothetical protein
MTADHPPFLLDLYSTSGRERLSLDKPDGGIALHEWTSWLRIRSDIVGFVPPTIGADDELTGFVPPAFEEDGLAVLAITRDSADLADRPIGLYHGRLDAEELEQVRRTVEQTPWPDLPRPVGGDFNAPNLAIHYERGSLLIRRGFNARCSNFIEAIAPLWALLDKILTRVNKSAAATLEAKLDNESDAADPLRQTLRVTLRNRGVGHVALTDPRVPTHDGVTPRLLVRVGELMSSNPHSPPHAWTLLPIPAPPQDAPRSLVLRPHGRFELSLPWVAEKPGSYLVRAAWNDYAGPLEAVRGQTPFMPVPAVGLSALGSGPYPVRGAVFAAKRIVVGQAPGQVKSR